MSLEPKDDPFNPSADYTAMIDDWRMIADIRAGARAIKDAGTAYLPQYEDESQGSYDFRLASTPWRPEWVDAHRNLCSKPFTKEVKLAGVESGRIKDYAEDIDGEGHNLHVFARDVFRNAVAAGLEALYVTFPDVSETRATATQAAEKATGVRPYWVHIPAVNILAVYTKKVNGRDVVSHIRFKEYDTKRNGYAEACEELVRVIDLPEGGGNPTSSCYRKVMDEGTKKYTIEQVGATATLTIPVIPVVLFFTGERSGNYRVTPPLLDLAHMQMEIYRALSREDEILTYAGSPMLAAEGMTPPKKVTSVKRQGTKEIVTETQAATIKTGPKRVLWAIPTQEGIPASWKYLQPDAANITAVSVSVQSKIDHFRQLAMQPTVRKSGNVTATGAVIDAAVAHSAVEAWANALKDVLEQAVMFTCMWIKETKIPEISVHTDFGVDVTSGDDNKLLAQMEKDGQISTDTMYDELGRRAFFGPQFDKDKEPAKVAADEKGRELKGETTIDPFSGKTVRKPVNDKPEPIPGLVN